MSISIPKSEHVHFYSIALSWGVVNSHWGSLRSQSFWRPSGCRAGSEADDLVHALVGVPSTFRLANQVCTRSSASLPALQFGSALAGRQGGRQLRFRLYALLNGRKLGSVLVAYKPAEGE